MSIIVIVRPDARKITRFFARARRWAWDVSQAVATRLLVDLGHHFGTWIRARVGGLTG